MSPERENGGRLQPAPVCARSPRALSRESHLAGTGTGDLSSPTAAPGQLAGGRVDAQQAYPAAGCARWLDRRYCLAPDTRLYLGGRFCAQHSPRQPAPDPARTAEGLRAAQLARSRGLRNLFGPAAQAAQLPAQRGPRPVRPDCPYCTPDAGYSCLAPARCDARLGPRR